MILLLSSFTLFPYTTLFRSENPEVETIKLFNDRFLLAMPKSRRISNRIRATPDLLKQDRLLLLEEGHCLQERSEEHTSELQSLRHLVCRLLLEKKKFIKHSY